MVPTAAMQVFALVRACVCACTCMLYASIHAYLRTCMAGVHRYVARTRLPACVVGHMRVYDARFCTHEFAERLAVAADVRANGTHIRRLFAHRAAPPGDAVGLDRQCIRHPRRHAAAQLAHGCMPLKSPSDY